MNSAKSKALKRVWQQVKPWLGLFFLAVILWFLARRLAGIDWKDVAESLRDIPWFIVTSLLGLTAVSYGIYCLYDWMSLRQYKGLGNHFTKIVPAFIAYAANFNFGGILGAVGMRVKLYSDLGLTGSQIAAIVALSTLGNWCGYMLLAGPFLLLAPPEFASDPLLAGIPWRLVGFILLVVLGALFVVQWRYGPRYIEKYRVHIPGWREGLLRTTLAVCNWTAVSGLLLCIFCWHFGAPISPVITAYFVSAIAGALIHVPGGLGIFETIFLAALAPHLPMEKIMAGMLTFRALYYFVPLFAALPLYFWFHFRIAPHYEAEYGSDAAAKSG